MHMSLLCLKLWKEEQKYKKQQGSIPAVFSLFRGAEMLASFEKNRYAPKCTKPNNRENNACYHVGSTGENPGYQIKIEKSNASPVQSTDNQNCKSNSV